MSKFYPEGKLFLDSENASYMKSFAALNEAYYSKKILEAKAILCDVNHNLVVDLGCMKGIIPREEGALGIREKVVRDIAMISKVNKPVCFVVTGFGTDSFGSEIAILSRREAQEICSMEYVSNFRIGDVISAKITHMEPFGAFADIGCGIVSFLPIDTISVSRIAHPRERFEIGMNIKAIVKSFDEVSPNMPKRVNLTHKELLGTWIENAEMFAPGETVSGIVRSVEDYGIFIELTPNLAGLAEYRDDIVKGQQVSVYIKNIIPEKMKIKLVIIDVFDGELCFVPPKYFFNGEHMDEFIYSPQNCTKLIYTSFKN